MTITEYPNQIDFLGDCHPLQPTLSPSKLIYNLTKFSHQDSLSLERVGFLEFEEFYHLPKGVLGLDIDLVSKPSLRAIYVAKAVNKPPNNIYFLSSAQKKPSQVFRYTPNGAVPRIEESWKELFFAFIYPKHFNNNLEKYLQTMPEYKVCEFVNNTPLSHILSFDYFYQQK